MVARMLALLLAFARASEDIVHFDDLSLLQLRASSVNLAQANLAEEKGHALVGRAAPDGASNIEFVDTGAGGFESAGKLGSVRFFVARAGNKGLRFRIYRPSGGGYKLVGQTEEIAVPTANVIQEVIFTEQVPFLAGDFIGWSHTGNGNIPFDGTGTNVFWNYNIINGGCSNVPNEGTQRRTYSYMITTVPAAAIDFTEDNLCGEDMPEGLDDAAAVGDPHITTNSGKHYDMDMMQTELAEEKGNALVGRAAPDGASNIEFVDTGAGGFESVGKLESVRFFVARAGNKGLRFRIYRPSGGGFKLVGQTEEIAVPTANVIQEVIFTEQVPFLAGDFIGWSHTGNGNIPFDGTGTNVFWNYNIINSGCGNVPNEGTQRRTYSYMITTAPAAATDFNEDNLCGEDMPEGLNDAAAVGDPHITTNSGKHYDMKMKN